MILKRNKYTIPNDLLQLIKKYEKDNNKESIFKVIEDICYDEEKISNNKKSIFKDNQVICYDEDYKEEEVTNKNEKHIKNIIEALYNNREPNTQFNKLLFDYIDKRYLKDSEVYKKANIDRRLFSKIRKTNYHPSKETVISIGLALELNKKELDNLLESASYSLPENNEFNIIINYCFKNEIYDYDYVNYMLYKFKQPLLSKNMK